MVDFFGLYADYKVAQARREQRAGPCPPLKESHKESHVCSQSQTAIRNSQKDPDKMTTVNVELYEALKKIDGVSEDMAKHAAAEGMSEIKSDIKFLKWGLAIIAVVLVLDYMSNL